MNLSWLVPERPGIPVLMYHKVWPGEADSLTISPENLRAQWTCLKNAGYRAIHLEEYLELVRKNGRTFPAKTVLLTFDDGYQNNFDHAYPLLQELGWCATFFLIAGAVNGEEHWAANGQEQKMGVHTLQQLDPKVVQLGYHGYHHEHFSKQSPVEILSIMDRSRQVFQTHGIPLAPVLAYPYGSRPKDKASLKSMKAALQAWGINCAFRIGNSVSTFPVQDRFEIRRIDVLGTDSLDDFAVKLKKGKLKPF